MKPGLQKPERVEITLISPEGKAVRMSEFFECPEVIIIGANGVSFDGWVFRTDRDFPDSDIWWLARQLELIRQTQGKERAEALANALEKLVMIPLGTPDLNPDRGGQGRVK